MEEKKEPELSCDDASGTCVLTIRDLFLTRQAAKNGVFNLIYLTTNCFFLNKIIVYY